MGSGVKFARDNPVATYLDQRVPDVQDRHTDVELIPGQLEVFLQPVEPSVCNGILVEFVHEVHGKHDRQNVPVELLDESFLGGRVDNARSKVIGGSAVVVFGHFLHIVVFDVIDMSFRNRFGITRSSTGGVV